MRGGPRLLEARGLVKRYSPHAPPAVAGVDLDLAEGSVTALLGPSGCGKTTTLRLIAGFERPDAGQVTLAGRTLAAEGVEVPPERRGIGFVFQDYALFPHLTVLQNAAFGLRGSGRERLERAREALAAVGLTVFQDRYPQELSGGQQQRVALARALAPQPKLVLLDEPFSSLDASLRAGTRAEVRGILERRGATALLVTHDQEEAMAFADRIVVMRDGRVEQDGSPEGVYRLPRTAFVANFLGRTNLLSATAAGSTASTPLGPVRLSSPASGPLMVSVRPEDLRFVAEGGQAAQVTGREFKGHDVAYTLDVDGLELVLYTTPDCLLKPGDEARVTVSGLAVPVGS
ncbi:MAG TPA: ABC transporter ATP-binding protein [Deinococcales bacterium]|nr:ABC transporter ATP-binding protein [Deinococcales bacterium]